MENTEKIIMEDDTGAKFIIPPDGDKGKTGKTEDLKKTISLNTLVKNN